MSIVDKIQKTLDANLPFVVYRKPNTNKFLAFFQKNDTLYTTKDYKEKGFVFAPFDDVKPSVLIPASFSEYKEEEFKVESAEFLNTVFCNDESSEAFHIDLVKKGIEAIGNDQFKKVVLSRKEVIEKKEVALISTFKKLLHNYKNAFVYMWFHPKVGLWMGATPETLIKINGSFFETMSLAGTQVYNANKEVCWQAKEIDEQQLVTNYVLEKLDKVCKTVKASKVETVKAGNLLHLKTLIKGEVFNNVSDLIQVLHPTPAVCGFPKIASKKFILKHEGYDRSFYTGFLGDINMPKSELFVNLRCMQVKQESVHVYVGGGITKESNPKKEWFETVAKSKTMKSVL